MQADADAMVTCPYCGQKIDTRDIVVEEVTMHSQVNTPDFLVYSCPNTTCERILNIVPKE